MSLGGPTFPGDFSLLYTSANTKQSSLLAEKPLRLPCSQMLTSKQFSHSVSTHSITGSASYSRSRNKNWELNNIVLSLVWCHPEIAIIAPACSSGLRSEHRLTAACGEEKRLLDVPWWSRVKGGCTDYEERLLFEIKKRSSTPWTLIAMATAMTTASSDQMSNTVQCCMFEMNANNLC